jgi:hypothetical protein
MTLLKRFAGIFFLVGLIAAWCIVVVQGFTRLEEHQNTPGPDSDAPRVWPADTRLARSTSGPTLLIFAHPRCPCTQATLNELARLTAKVQGRMAAIVVFSVPASRTAEWARTRSWAEAEAIPGAEVVCDTDGAETARFGARTSGSALLYDNNGRLRFCGGITAARGHAGDSAGQAAILANLGPSAPACPTAPVYGCPLCQADATSP